MKKVHCVHVLLLLLSHIFDAKHPLWPRLPLRLIPAPMLPVSATLVLQSCVFFCPMAFFTPLECAALWHPTETILSFRVTPMRAVALPCHGLNITFVPSQIATIDAAAQFAPSCARLRSRSRVRLPCGPRLPCLLTFVLRLLLEVVSHSTVPVYRSSKRGFLEDGTQMLDSFKHILCVLYEVARWPRCLGSRVQPLDCRTAGLLKA